MRIYLGAAPGVGKTFAMLGEAHRRLERGTDLVAAVVETHGRAKTAELLEGIEIIPPHYIEYRGSRFPELDVPAVLARRPQVVLVDELAHTNTPGSMTDKASSGPNGDFGGNNPSQEGMGPQVAAITTLFHPGATLDHRG